MLTQTWLPRLSFAPVNTAPRGDTLVVVFLRGAADVLNMIVPHGEDAYYQLRPSLGIRATRRLKEPRKKTVPLTSMASSAFIPPCGHCSKHGKANTLPSSTPAAHPTNRAVISKPWNSWSAAWTMNAVPPQVGSDVTLPH